MSDITVETNRLQAETAKLNAEAAKLNAETFKLAAEQNKLVAETLKLDRDRRFAPLAAIGVFFGSMIGAAAIVIRLLWF